MKKWKLRKCQRNGKLYSNVKWQVNNVNTSKLFRRIIPKNLKKLVSARLRDAINAFNLRVCHSYIPVLICECCTIIIHGYINCVLVCCCCDCEIQRQRLNYMASLVFVLGSFCVDLYRIGCVFVNSGCSIGECWDFITEQRQQQLIDLYLKRFARSSAKRCCDIPIEFRTYRRSEYIALEMQREPTDDELIDDFVDIGADEPFEWHPVRLFIFLLWFEVKFVSVAVLYNFRKVAFRFPFKHISDCKMSSLFFELYCHQVAWKSIWRISVTFSLSGKLLRLKFALTKIDISAKY